MSGMVTTEGLRPGLGGARQRLADPAMWRTLLGAADLPGFVSAWLALVAAQIDSALAAHVPSVDGRIVTFGFVALRQEAVQRFGRAGRYGEGEPSLLLGRAAERCLQMRRPILQNGDTEATPCQLVVPIMTGERLDGAVALELLGSAQGHLDAAMRLVNWGLGWYARMLDRGREAGTGFVAEAGLSVIDLVLQDSSTAAAAQAACTMLASRMDVARVSLGARFGSAGLEPMGTSGGALASTPTDFVIALRAAMEEAVQAGQAIACPGGPDQLAATGAHQRLLRSHGSAWAVSLPVACPPHGDVVLTIEGESAAQGRTPTSLQMVQWDMVARALAPAFVARVRAERGVVPHAFDAAQAEMRRWHGSGARDRRILAGLGVLVALFLVFGRGEYSVSAKATLEGVVKRAIVSPFDSYLAEAHARPGDRVAEGTVLAQLDARDLQLQRSDHEARRAESQRQMDEAIGKRDLAGAGIAAAKRDQEDAELKLIRENLTRTQLTAPFAGIVISGDPAQNIGAPLRRGDIVYELSPLDAFRVAIEVDQADFADVEPGQPGRLVLTPLPTEVWDLKVASVTPIATARDGRTAFRVDATLDTPAAALRPGMQGIAKIDVGRRRYVWIWTHDAVNWVRLKLWEYLP